MHKFHCDQCNKEVTGDDDYLYIKDCEMYVGTDSIPHMHVILCSKECSINWIKDYWKGVGGTP